MSLVGATFHGQFGFTSFPPQQIGVEPMTDDQTPRRIFMSGFRFNEKKRTI